MRRSPLRRLSKKQARRERELQKIAPPLDNRCQECGRVALLHRHHEIHRSQGGDDTPGNIQFLCPICHMRAHNLRVFED